MFTYLNKIFFSNHLRQLVVSPEAHGNVQKTPPGEVVTTSLSRLKKEFKGKTDAGKHRVNWSKSTHLRRKYGRTLRSSCTQEVLIRDFYPWGWVLGATGLGNIPLFSPPPGWDPLFPNFPSLFGSSKYVKAFDAWWEFQEPQFKWHNQLKVSPGHGYWPCWMKLIRSLAADVGYYFLWNWNTLGSCFTLCTGGCRFPRQPILPNL